MQQEGLVAEVANAVDRHNDLVSQNRLIYGRVIVHESKYGVELAHAMAVVKHLAGATLGRTHERVAQLAERDFRQR